MWLLNVHRRYDAVNEYILIGDARFIGCIDKFRCQCTPLVFIPGKPLWPPHECDHICLVFDGEGDHVLISFRPAHDRIDDGLPFVYGESGLHGLYVGSVQTKRGGLPYLFLDCLDDKFH